MRTAYRELKERSWLANQELPKSKLVVSTFGNASVYDREKSVLAIKPSGVEYDKLTIDDIVVVDLDGKSVEGRLQPSSDTKTHVVLYRNFVGLGGIVHTHSSYATGWAQACSAIPIYGTTHADHLAEDVPCTALMSEAAVKRDYETETGAQILECFKNRDPLHTPMVLVAGHGAFTWGESSEKAVYHALVLEQIAKMAFITRTINRDAARLPDHIIRKHFERKHGTNAYYGQARPQ